MTFALVTVNKSGRISKVIAFTEIRGHGDFGTGVVASKPAPSRWSSLMPRPRATPSYNRLARLRVL